MSSNTLISLLLLIGIFIRTSTSNINATVDAVDNSIIYYEGNVGLIPCTYCTEEYFSSKQVYYREECFNKYNLNNSIIRGNKVYHPLCVSLSLPANHDYYKDALCPYPIIINNGRADLINDYKVTDWLSIKTKSPIVGAKLKVSCDAAYIPTLSSLSECVVQNNTPVWFPEPECKRIACLAVPDPENGVSLCSDGFQANGSICNISCKSGFTASSVSSTCHEGNWTSTLSCVQQHSQDESGIVLLIIFLSLGIFIIVAVCITCCYILYNKKKQHKPGYKKPDVSVSTNSTTESISLIITRDSDFEPDVQPDESDELVPSTIPQNTPSHIVTDPSHVNENSGGTKEPVEHEDIEGDVVLDLFSRGDKKSEPVEDDERTTLSSNGSDLIHQVEGLPPLDSSVERSKSSDTVPKEVVPSEQTYPKQLDIQKPESANQKRQPAGKQNLAMKDHLPLPGTSQEISGGDSSIPSKPSLGDFGLSRHPSDASFNQKRLQNTAVAETNADTSMSFLKTNPVAIFATENCDDAQDTGRGTMDLVTGIAADS